MTAGTVEASRSSRATTGSVDERPRISSDEHEQRAEPGRQRADEQLECARGLVGEDRRGPVRQRGRDGALTAGCDLEQLQGEPLARFGEGACCRRQALALGQGLLERGQPLARQADARNEIFVLARGGAGGAIGVVGEASELGRRRTTRGAPRLVEVAAKLGEQPVGRLVPDAKPLHSPTQGEQCISAAAGQQRLGLRPAGEHLLEVGGKQPLRISLDCSHARPALLGLDLQPCALGGGCLGSRRGSPRDRFELDRRGWIVRAYGLELGPERRCERGGRLVTEDDALTAAPQPVQRCRRLLARTCGVGQLFFGALALRDQGADLLVKDTALLGRLGSACVGLGAAFGERGQVERCDRGLQPDDLEPELLRALGRGRLQRQRAKTFLDLVLEVTSALDLHGDACKLQLCPVAAALEASEPGGLLDQLAPFVRLRVEHRLDATLGDDRPQAPTETDVGQQLDEVDAAYRRLVDEVLPLPASLELAGDRNLGVGKIRPGAVGIVEQQLDFAEVDVAPRPTEPAKRTSSGFSARSSPGLIEPVAQRIESETFDFPEPFGPTTTETPGSRRISTGSTNDLNPRSLMAFRCTREEAIGRPGWDFRYAVSAAG